MVSILFWFYFNLALITRTPRAVITLLVGQQAWLEDGVVVLVVAAQENCTVTSQEELIH